MQLKDEIRFYLYFDKKGIDSIYHQFPDSDSNYTETTMEHINGNFDMDLDISSLLHMATWSSKTSAGVGRDIKREQPIEISYEEKVKCIENHLDARCIGFLPDLLKNLSRHTSSLIACRGLFKLTEAVVETTSETISTYAIQRNPYSYDQLSFDFISTPIPGDFSRGEIMQKAMEEYGYYAVEMYLSGANTDEIWKINEKFLDIQISSGREIYLSHDPTKYVGGNSFYSKEIGYLIENGYKFVKEGDIWHAIR